MNKKMKKDEEWALELLIPLIKQRYKEGFKVRIPDEDPPDCIIEPLNNMDTETKIEFTALGPKKYFEYVSVMLSKRTPYIAELQIPYEPEYWIEDIIKRKKYPDNDKYDVLCTHFCSYFNYPGFKKKANHQDLTTTPFKVSGDMFHRFQNVIWQSLPNKNNLKAIVLVQPNAEPIRLTPQKKPLKAREIDISLGYPTIQISIANLPNGKKIEWDKIENLSKTFNPINKMWKTPDVFRLPKPFSEGQMISLIHRQSNEDKLIDNSLVFTVNMSMPKIKYLKE